MSEAFLCAGLRTPIGRYGGALSSVRPDDMLAGVIQAVLERAGLATVDEVIAGCANQAGEDNRNVARMAALLAGLPESVPAMTVNRLCASGLDAVSLAARAVKTGEAEVVIAGGVESMSRAPFVMPKPDAAFSRRAEVHDTTLGWRFVNKALAAQYGTHSMPETAENVAEEFDISRADQDAFALRSQERALAAIDSGWMLGEIAPVSVPQRRGDPVVVARDEHPRETTLEKLAGLPTPFHEGGTVTAGNASGINDGAAGVIVASESAVAARGLTPLARIAGTVSVGVPPRIMGIGPLPATQALLEKHELQIGDIDVIELNEAFAAQVLAVTRGLGLADDDPVVNTHGGAIALGHPLGMSGTRLALTAARQLQAGKGRAIATMCVGVGQGVAMLLEAP